MEFARHAQVNPARPGNGFRSLKQPSTSLKNRGGYPTINRASGRAPPAASNAHRTHRGRKYLKATTNPTPLLKINPADIRRTNL